MRYYVAANVPEPVLTQLLVESSAGVLKVGKRWELLESVAQ
ncbi:hypothetical protein [Arthrobacter alpinus]|nr:hypothetical protein [Arthrobacter alpinus]